MRKFLTIILIGIFNLTFSQVETKVNGKIVDENFNCLSGVRIRNLNNGYETKSNKNGRYEIIASGTDSLKFNIAGLSTEIIKTQTKTVNLIMIDKRIICFGNDLSEIQYRNEPELFEKKLKNLYKKARRLKIWETSSCQQQK